jgi:hypothetical protein
MRSTKAKEIKNAINLNLKTANPIQKRLYKRLKKAYNKLSHEDKSSFVNNLKLQFNEKQ